MRPWTMEVPYFCQKRSIVRVQILKWSEGQRIDLKKVMQLLINYKKLPKRYRKSSENHSKIAQNLTKNRPKIAPSCLLLPKKEYCSGPDIEVIRRSEDWSTKKWYVFCYQNCSDLLWEKNCSSDRIKVL